MVLDYCLLRCSCTVGTIYPRDGCCYCCYCCKGDDGRSYIGRYLLRGDRTLYWRLSSMTGRAEQSRAEQRDAVGNHENLGPP